MRLLAMFLLTVPLGGATELAMEARWKRLVRPDVAGTLTIGDGGISFRPTNPDRHALSWTFDDVQHFDRTSTSEIAIQGYLDSVLRLGRDRRYRFALTEGEFSDELYSLVVERIGKPATDRVSRKPTDSDLSIPAKRVRLLRGSQGMLHFTAGTIVYETQAQGEARVWRLDRDVETVWSSDPYRMEVHVLGDSEAFVRRVEVYRFALKRPLDADYYQRLRLKLYGIRTSRRGETASEPDSLRDSMVLEEGVEPSCPVRGAGF